MFHHEGLFQLVYISHHTSISQSIKNSTYINTQHIDTMVKHPYIKYWIKFHLSFPPSVHLHCIVISILFTFSNSDHSVTSDLQT